MSWELGDRRQLIPEFNPLPVSFAQHFFCFPKLQCVTLNLKEANMA
jgi:hypothetical protein